MTLTFFWPSRSPRLTVIRVLLLRQSTKCKFSSMTHTGQIYHVTLWPWPLTLEVRVLAADAGLRPPSAHQLWSSYRPYIRKIWHILCVCVSLPVTLTLHLLTLKLLRNTARVMGYPAAKFGDTTTIRFRFMGHWANTAQADHVTLWPWPLTLEVMAPVADADHRLPSVYQVSSS